MKLQHLRVGLRILAKDPKYSLVTIMGLGVGIGVCLLLLGYARYCWQYNASVPDAANVYIVKQRDNLALGTPWNDQVPIGLITAAGTAPGVASATGYVGWLPLTTQVNGQLRKLNSLTVLPGFAEMMGLQVIRGDINEALSHPDRFAITEDAAIRLFGTSDVLGKTVLLRLSAVDENQSTARIAAILRSPPANTTIPFDTLNGSNLGLIPPMLHDQLVSGASSWPGYLLLRIRPGTSPADVSEVLQQALEQGPMAQKVPPELKARLKNRNIMDIKLSPLREAYFDRDVVTTFTSVRADRGNASTVRGIVVVAIIIVGLAAFNYVNLATIRVLRRQREIAIRKVLGAGQNRLALQFVAESLLVSLLATATGLLLACLLLPVFSTLMNRQLASLLSPENILAAMGLGLALGLLIALYPVRIVFGVRPSVMLAGRPDTESVGSKRLRQALAVLQVAAAIGLASFTLAVSWQTRFAAEASPGFNPSELLVFDLPVSMSAQDPKPRSFITALSQLPGVTGIAISNDPVGRSKELWSTEIKRDDGTAVNMDVKTVSANFFEVYGIRPVAGRLFNSTIDRDDSAVPIVVNALAARQLGFASPALALGQSLQFKSSNAEAPVVLTKRIVGIAPEIRFYSLRAVPAALAYQLRSPGGSGWDGTLTIRAQGSIKDMEHAVQPLWTRYFPNSVLEIHPAKDVYAANYADDARLARLLAFSTVIAMLIAGFGVYVLVADAVQRRTKEIALRKLFGTNRRDIGKLVAKEIASIILLSATIAVPLATLAIARYLAGYIEHEPDVYWSLAFAVVATLAAATIAAARQAWVAMTLKPAVALRA